MQMKPEHQRHDTLRTHRLAEGSGIVAFCNRVADGEGEKGEFFELCAAGRSGVGGEGEKQSILRGAEIIGRMLAQAKHKPEVSRENACIGQFFVKQRLRVGRGCAEGCLQIGEDIRKPGTGKGFRVRNSKRGARGSRRAIGSRRANSRSLCAPGHRKGCLRKDTGEENQGKQERREARPAARFCFLTETVFCR